MPTALILTGHGNFRLKLALSLITARKVVIKQIRHKICNPGVDEAEVALLKLIDEVTNGTVARINDTGTIVTFTPGTLLGGSFTFDCPNCRGIGYFLEFLLFISPFCKSELDVCLKGVTDSLEDPSVSMINHSFLPLYRKFVGLSSSSHIKLDLKVRGVSPHGGGEVHLVIKPCSKILPIDKRQIGKVYRIRGVSWGCRVSPSYCQRVIAGAKSLLNQFLSDVYITIDHRKGEYAGKSPGFGLTLYAESNCGAVYSSQAISEPEGNANVVMDAEAVGKLAAGRLFDQISERGYIDCGPQTLAFLLMACESGHNASRLAIGNLTEHSITSLRLIHDFIGVTFHFNYQSPFESNKLNDVTDGSLEPCKQQCLDPTAVLVATCFGAGIRNINKSIR